MPNRKTMYNLELLKSTTKALRLSEQWMFQVQEDQLTYLKIFIFFLIDRQTDSLHMIFDCEIPARSCTIKTSLSQGY